MAILWISTESLIITFVSDDGGSVALGRSLNFSERTQVFIEATPTSGKPDGSLPGRSSIIIFGNDGWLDPRKGPYNRWPTATAWFCENDCREPPSDSGSPNRP